MKLRIFSILIVTTIAFAAIGCGEVSPTFTDAGPATDDNRICGAQLAPMSLEELHDRANEVELLHFKVSKLSDASTCAPRISRLNYRLLSQGMNGSIAFWPQIKMTINGQEEEVLTLGEQGRFNTLWQLQTFSWVGEIHPTTNIGGEIIKLTCVNCNDNLPTGTSIISSLTQWEWVNNPEETVASEHRIDIKHFTAFAL